MRGEEEHLDVRIISAGNGSFLHTGYFLAIWRKFINRPPHQTCARSRRAPGRSRGNSKQRVLAGRRPMQPGADVNARSAVIGDDVWLTGTVSHHHNYDRARSYSRFKARILRGVTPGRPDMLSGWIL